MSYLRLILGLVQFINWITSELDKRRLIKEGETRALNRAIVLMRGRVEQAIEIREQVANSTRGITSTSGLPDDGFRRD